MVWPNIAGAICRFLATGLLVFLVANTSQAATHYVRAGAAGANNGSDWTNAYTQLPATLVRGDTYYVADGNYPSYTFDDPDSSTLIITVKKATVADHGTAPDWLSSYGDGQAVFTAPITFSTDYHVFDGVARNSDWLSGYGFKIDNFVSPANMAGLIHLGTDDNTDPASFITVQFVDIEGSHSDNDTIQDAAVFHYMGGTNNTISKCYIHHTGSVQFRARNADNFTIELNYIFWDDDSPANHAEGISISNNIDNLTIRWNIWKDIEGTAFIATPSGAGATANSNWEIYGNVFFYSETNKNDPSPRHGVGDGVISFFGGAQGQINGFLRIYNNSFINIDEEATGGTLNRAIINCESNVSGMGDIEITNNLWYANQPVSSLLNIKCSYNSLTISHNAYFDQQNNDTDPNEQEVNGVNPFMNYSAENFRLSQATNAGLILSSPYDTDLDGNTRGDDGVWDRGAFEFQSGQTRPLPPSNLRVVSVQ